MYDNLLRKKENLTREEIEKFLDDILPVILRLEDEINIMDFFNDCIDTYICGDIYGFEYDTARDEFLDRVFK